MMPSSIVAKIKTLRRLRRRPLFLLQAALLHQAACHTAPALGFPIAFTLGCPGASTWIWPIQFAQWQGNHEGNHLGRIMEPHSPGSYFRFPNFQLDLKSFPSFFFPRSLSSDSYLRDFEPQLTLNSLLSFEPAGYLLYSIFYLSS
jgi:hypothetical protein